MYSLCKLLPFVCVLWGTFAWTPVNVSNGSDAYINHHTPSRRSLLASFDPQGDADYASVVLLRMINQHDVAAIGVGSIIHADPTGVIVLTCAHNLREDYPDAKRTPKKTIQAYVINKPKVPYSGLTFFPAAYTNPIWIYTPYDGTTKHVGDWGLIKYGPPKKKQKIVPQTAAEAPKAKVGTPMKDRLYAQLVTYNTATSEPKSNLGKIKGVIEYEWAASDKLLESNNRWDIEVTSIKETGGVPGTKCLLGMGGMSGSPLFSTRDGLAGQQIGVFVGKKNIGDPPSGCITSKKKNPDGTKSRNVYVPMTDARLMLIGKMVTDPDHYKTLSGSPKILYSPKQVKLKHGSESASQLNVLDLAGASTGKKKRTWTYAYAHRLHKNMQYRFDSADYESFEAENEQNEEKKGNDENEEKEQHEQQRTLGVNEYGAKQHYKLHDYQYQSVVPDQIAYHTLNNGLLITAMLVFVAILIGCICCLSLICGTSIGWMLKSQHSKNKIKPSYNSVAIQDDHDSV